jgi:glycosyltransferase involved in cell wall biosynthesis
MDGGADLAVPAGGMANLDGVHVHYFPVPMFRRLCWCPSMLAALKATAAGFDVMHLHSMFQWPTYAAARVAAAVGVPYLVAPRGMLGRAVIRGKSRFVKAAWIRWVEQETLSNAAGLHVTTELESAEIRALGLRLPTIYCVPNSVTWPARHVPLDGGPFAALERPFVLFLSRIDRKKGLDRLIEAWQWVPGVTLVIAGNDEDNYRPTLERLAADHQVRDRIVFVGPVTDEHKWALYENAVLFTLPSYSENFGNVVAEAMAMGCPVVVTPEVGLASLVEESGCGIVVDGAPRVLAQAITSLVQDPERRRSMAERGRSAARSRLSPESAGGRMEAVYRRVCGRLGAVHSPAA